MNGTGCDHGSTYFVIYARADTDPECPCICKVSRFHRDDSKKGTTAIQSVRAVKSCRIWSRFRRDNPQMLITGVRVFFVNGESALFSLFPLCMPQNSECVCIYNHWVTGDSALVTGHSALLFAVLSLYISSSAMYMHIQPLLETFV